MTYCLEDGIVEALSALDVDMDRMNQQYAELAELAGGFIHEIKNHLGTLGLNLQLLAEDFEQPETPRERRALTRVQKLQTQCQHVVEVANDFLRFAKIKDLHLEPANLSKILEEMIDFFAPTARAADIDIKSFLPCDLPLVPLEPELFKQALLNLMLNAEQAMPEGGQLTIQAAVEMSADCSYASGPEGDGQARPVVSLQLIDTGKGIQPEQLARIFEPFFSTKQGGSGLGLPTTRRIIDAHGGSLSVESAPGRGSKFTIRLPAVVSEDIRESPVG